MTTTGGHLGKNQNHAGTIKDNILLALHDGPLTAAQIRDKLGGEDYYGQIRGHLDTLYTHHKVNRGIQRPPRLWYLAN